MNALLIAGTALALGFLLGFLIAILLTSAAMQSRLDELAQGEREHDA